MEGLEPTHLAALDPKSSVSTNFTTSAEIIFSPYSSKIVFQITLHLWKASAKIMNYFHDQQIESIFFTISKNKLTQLQRAHLYLAKAADETKFQTY